MYKKHFFLAVLMLGFFSSASFASIKTGGESPDSEHSITNFEFKDHWSGKPDNSWVKAVKDPKYCEIKDDNGWDSSWDGHFGHHEDHHGHHDGDDHHGDHEGPSSVPLPPAIWLFGSALLGLIGLRRKTDGTPLAV